MPQADRRGERAPRRWRDAALAALLVALAFVAYAPSLPGEFIWDDNDAVTNNDTLRSAAGLWRTWTDPRANQQYYPLTHTSFWIEARLWGLRPAGYRVTNMLLHGLAAVLLWRLLQRLGVPGAWLGAALFAMHPVNAESVAWITERKNVLSGALALGSALAFVRYLERRERRWWGWSLALFAAALCAKTAVAFLPLALLVLAWWVRPRLSRADLLAVAPFLGLALVGGAVTAWLEVHHVAQGEAWEIPLVERIGLAGRAAWFYAGKLVWPVGLTFIYPRWDPAATLGTNLLCGAAALAVAGALWFARDRLGRGPFAGLAIYALALAPALGAFDVYFFRYSFVQDHFQYYASAALLALAAAAVARAAGRRAGVLLGVSAVLLAVLVPLSWSRARAFSTSEALWRDTLAKNPAAWMAHHNLGLLLGERGDDAGALEHLRVAVRLRGDYAEAWRAHRDMGLILERSGRPAEALAEYAEWARLAPDRADAHNAYAIGLERTGRLPEALAEYREALRLDPALAEAHNNLAIALMKAGDPAGAWREVRRARELGVEPHPGFLRALAEQMPEPAP
ncbi:MAG: tetratricopeptide repeat protein [Acidobacteria bacterium]|nr:tetratricopeptide repeat protein [Acidobacteriota bacterium]